MLPKKILEEVEKVSKELKLNEEDKNKLIKEVEKEYLNMMAEPGEAVGILAAQSISEPATQLTMRTYHIWFTKTDRDIRCKKKHRNPDDDDIFEKRI
jgi:DNA-directed RNA polymerase beta' subunit